jgi:hypothetical protein
MIVKSIRMYVTYLNQMVRVCCASTPWKMESSSVEVLQILLEK